jgi:hypothetical protein
VNEDEDEEIRRPPENIPDMPSPPGSKEGDFYVLQFAEELASSLPVPPGLADRSRSS